MLMKKSAEERLSAESCNFTSAQNAIYIIFFLFYVLNIKNVMFFVFVFTVNVTVAEDLHCMAMVSAKKIFFTVLLDELYLEWPKDK